MVSVSRYFDNVLFALVVQVILDGSGAWMVLGLEGLRCCGGGVRQKTCVRLHIGGPIVWGLSRILTHRWDGIGHDDGDDGGRRNGCGDSKRREDCGGRGGRRRGHCRCGRHVEGDDGVTEIAMATDRRMHRGFGIETNDTDKGR